MKKHESINVIKVGEDRSKWYTSNREKELSRFETYQEEKRGGKELM